jgi:hypothetical protein
MRALGEKLAFSQHEQNVTRDAPPPRRVSREKPRGRSIEAAWLLSQL